MDEVLLSIQDFARNIRIIDFLDVAFISLVLYLLLNWFRKSASRRTIIAVITLICLYVLARVTEMYLTELLLEALFVVVLIGTVVVFQSDIRRLADQIGSSRLFQGKDNTTKSDKTTIDIITETAAKMAENRTGALIAIRGKEDWDRHIHGGIALEGNVSIPLLYSIFNPSAPGHDGAVLIENNKIKKFGVHLPLSTELDKIVHGGTRHAAALGLSELCDALIVIVSEERGVISYAHSGYLKEVESASELKNRLLSFWEEHYQVKDSTWSHRWEKTNWRTALASISLAILFWFAFSYNAETIYRTFSVPIEYRNLNSNNIVLEDSVPIEARVTLSGPEQAFRLLDPSQLIVSFNLASENITSDQLEITEKNINIPSDLNLYEVSPQYLSIDTSSMKSIDVPVKLRTSGVLPSSLTLESIITKPSAVNILVHEKNKPDSIAIEPIDLSSIDQSTTITKKLDLPPDTRLPDGDTGEVDIIIKIRSQDE